MSDTQMKNVGQKQAAKKPTKNKIDCADQQSSPRSQMRRREIHRSERVEKNNQVTNEIVDFHGDSPVGVFNQKSGLLSNNKLM
jgi:hypothetical protein